MSTFAEENPWSTDALGFGPKAAPAQVLPPLPGQGSVVPCSEPNGDSAALGVACADTLGDEPERQALISIQRVDRSRAEFCKLRADNQTLVEYINNLMSATGSPTK
ncbi:hypothetical protein HK105_201137 [Polyrhizophydium stewartii]|uniref:Uncharacterized protein n=1 Tax=Polyrhizophydium stewartii TaxID=2732419 RepID=A0ABR4NIX6_9FUNG